MHSLTTRITFNLQCPKVTIQIPNKTKQFGISLKYVKEKLKVLNAWQVADIFLFVTTAADKSLPHLENLAVSLTGGITYSAWYTAL